MYDVWRIDIDTWLSAMHRQVTVQTLEGAPLKCAGIEGLVSQMYWY